MLPARRRWIAQLAQRLRARLLHSVRLQLQPAPHLEDCARVCLAAGDGPAVATIRPRTGGCESRRPSRSHPQQCAQSGRAPGRLRLATATLASAMLRSLLPYHHLHHDRDRHHHLHANGPLASVLEFCGRQQSTATFAGVGKAGRRTGTRPAKQSGESRRAHREREHRTPRRGHLPKIEMRPQWSTARTRRGAKDHTVSARPACTRAILLSTRPNAEQILSQPLRFHGRRPMLL